jgi:hypothetical protein
MPQYVWCKNDECRIPAFRCILCRQDCYNLRSTGDGQVDAAFEVLKSSGKFKECFIMKRRENSEARNQLSFFEKEEKKEDAETSGNEGNGHDQSYDHSAFILEGQNLKPFSPEEYTASTIYQALESFSVECKLVRPEEQGNMVFEGRKPSKKTVPILVKKTGECVILNSWEELEAQPEQLAETRDVVGAMPVKQVFVLKRR